MLPRSYEIPAESQALEQQISACDGSSRFDVWQVGACVVAEAVVAGVCGPAGGC